MSATKFSLVVGSQLAMEWTFIVKCINFDLHSVWNQKLVSWTAELHFPLF